MRKGRTKYTSHEADEHSRSIGVLDSSIVLGAPTSNRKVSSRTKRSKGEEVGLTASFEKMYFSNASFSPNLPISLWKNFK